MPRSQAIHVAQQPWRNRCQQDEHVHEEGDHSTDDGADSFIRAVIHKSSYGRSYCDKDDGKAGRRFKIEGRHRIKIPETIQYALQNNGRSVLDAYVIDAYALKFSVPHLHKENAQLDEAVIKD